MPEPGVGTLGGRFPEGIIVDGQFFAKTPMTMLALALAVGGLAAWLVLRR